MPATETSAIFSRRSVTPVVFLFIDGNPAPDLERRLIKFDYKKTTKKASETKLTFKNEPAGITFATEKHLALDQDKRFFANTVWKFRFGYFNNMSPIHTGILRSIEPVYGDRHDVTVTLFDSSSMLGKSSSSKNWGKVPSSDIAQQIAVKYDLEAVIEITNDIPEKAFIQPGEINDLQFLRDLAAQIHYECYVHDSPPTLIYRSIVGAYDLPALSKFTYWKGDGGIVKSFKPKIKSLGEIKTQTSKAQGKKKDGGKGKGSEASVNSKKRIAFGTIVGGGLRGDPALNDVLTGGFDQHNITPVTGLATPTELVVISDPANPIGGIRFEGGVKKLFDKLSKDQAKNKGTAHRANLKRVADTKRQQLLDKAESASSDHPLLPNIFVGRSYTWDGFVDKIFAGNWYCTEASHTISGTGSNTSLTWQRDDPAKKNANKKKASSSKKELTGPLDSPRGSPALIDMVIGPDSVTPITPKPVQTATPSFPSDNNPALHNLLTTTRLP